MNVPITSAAMSGPKRLSVFTNRPPWNDCQIFESRIGTGSNDTAVGTLMTRDSNDTDTTGTPIPSMPLTTPAIRSTKAHQINTSMPSSAIG